MLKRPLLALLLCLGMTLSAARAATVPRHSPEFAINMVGGKQILLSQYRGKVVALLFILTYCPHCQKTVSTLSKFQGEYAPRGFQVLSSAIEDMAAMALPDFMKRFNPPFPVGYNERNAVIEYLQHPEMLKLLMPQLVFVDRQGTIRAQFSGDQPFFGDDQEKNIRQEIEKLLGSGPAAARKRAKK
jgi:peroxiredoxin